MLISLLFFGHSHKHHFQVCVVVYNYSGRLRLPWYSGLSFPGRRRELRYQNINKPHQPSTFNILPPDSNQRHHLHLWLCHWILYFECSGSHFCFLAASLSWKIPNFVVYLFAARLLGVSPTRYPSIRIARTPQLSGLFLTLTPPKTQNCVSSLLRKRHHSDNPF